MWWAGFVCYVQFAERISLVVVVVVVLHDSCLFSIQDEFVDLVVAAAAPRFRRLDFRFLRIRFRGRSSEFDTQV
jgi:hypothetical protein